MTSDMIILDYSFIWSLGKKKIYFNFYFFFLRLYFNIAIKSIRRYSSVNLNLF